MFQRVRCRVLQETAQEVTYRVKLLKQVHEKTYSKASRTQEELVLLALQEVAQQEGFSLASVVPVAGEGCYEVVLEDSAATS